MRGVRAAMVSRTERAVTGPGIGSPCGTQQRERRAVRRLASDRLAAEESVIRPVRPVHQLIFWCCIPGRIVRKNVLPREYNAILFETGLKVRRHERGILRFMPEHTEQLFDLFRVGEARLAAIDNAQITGLYA